MLDLAVDTGSGSGPEWGWWIGLDGMSELDGRNRNPEGRCFFHFLCVCSCGLYRLVLVKGVAR
ncbi:hypothetical protein OFL98_29575, partial [Escherichia coli]|nr:hypothetical protein [Escherichia coli]